MTNDTAFLSATPVLASLDIKRTVAFYTTKLGFAELHAEQDVYGVVTRGNVSLHFWACDDRKIAEATSCRVRVTGIDALYAQCCEYNIVHPNAPLEDKPWDSREFGIVDPDGNLITFAEHGDD
jgi:catechol 2,3-dioxygenase-like lactoylglutathione lyase family enzyme